MTLDVTGYGYDAKAHFAESPTMEFSGYLGAAVLYLCLAKMLSGCHADLFLILKSA